MSTPEILLGTELPDVAVWSDRVVVALGQNPSAFTGPGTNTFLVGTGDRRLLIDPGDGRDDYLPILDRALERAGGVRLHEIVLTHGHPDHLGGVASVQARHGPVPVRKMPWPEVDGRYPGEIDVLGDDDVVETEGATLRAVHTPGHAPDHLCFLLEEENALFSGDNVLGIGTTVIPNTSGDLADYMASLERLRAIAPARIYPAHGPLIADGPAKIREYIDHRNEREGQIHAQLGASPKTVMEIVEVVYAAYPKRLHPAASQSTTQHLRKLERDGRASFHGPGEPTTGRWSLP